RHHTPSSTCFLIQLPRRMFSARVTGSRCEGRTQSRYRQPVQYAWSTSHLLQQPAVRALDGTFPVELPVAVGRHGQGPVPASRLRILLHFDVELAEDDAADGVFVHPSLYGDEPGALDVVNPRLQVGTSSHVTHQIH